MNEKTAYWGFPIRDELHEEARETAERIQKGDDGAKKLSGDAANIVIQLTDHGLESYYQRPTEIAPLSGGLQKTADSGIKAVMSAIRMVIRQFFSKRSEDELRELSVYLESMLWVHPETGEAHLVFSIDDELHQRATDLIEQTRNDSHPENYIGDVIDTLCEVVELSIQNYYHQPTDKVSMGRVTKKSADMGISTAEKGIRRLLDKLLRSLKHEQLVELSYHLESLIHDEARTS